MSESSPSAECPDPLVFPLSAALSPPRYSRAHRPQALIREVPEDFFVEERLGFAPRGVGEHLWLFIEKRLLNTDEVVAHLANAFDVPRRDIGFAGLKDRNAVTRQWFSLPARGDVARDPAGTMERAGLEGLRLLEHAWHERKLRRGANSGNAFCIRITAVDEVPPPEGLDAQAAMLRSRGVPNYFGPQRFGHRGGNVEKAEALFAGRIRRAPRHLRGMYLSAARALLFNQVLARRVLDGSWDRLRGGEVVALDGRNAFFLADEEDPGSAPEALEARRAAFDIHPSGPLWGRGEPLARGEVAALEADVIGASPQLSEGLARAGLRQERRSLRLPVRGLSLEGQTGGWIARFELPKGCFATAVLAELFDLDTALA